MYPARSLIRAGMLLMPASTARRPCRVEPRHLSCISGLQPQRTMLSRCKCTWRKPSNDFFLWKSDGQRYEPPQLEVVQVESTRSRKSAAHAHRAEEQDRVSGHVLPCLPLV